ncbi:MAG: Hint domain-containing protein [Paracoccus sp. (in: a-proteobacteria)]
MSYMIATYTFTSAVPSTSDFPFASQQGISFADAQETIIYLDDSDNSFEPATTISDPGQALLVDTELGGSIITAGAVLTYRQTKIGVIVDPDGNQYLVMFPHIASSSASSPTEIGDRSTVMIVPATTTTPPFDPQSSYGWFSTRSASSIPVVQTDIPPDYLNPSCFTAGTLIETASGLRPVETLVAGDLVLTRDHGLRPISWAGGRWLSARCLNIGPNLRPVRIRAGALGAGQPARDLIVSPQHRILIRSKIADRIGGSAEMLVAAKHLCALPGIEALSPANGVGYYHILFDRHEAVRSNGCWTESLYTGPQALKSISPAARREIRALFPELFVEGAAPAPGARPFLSGRAAKELTRRHLKNDRPLIAS